MPVYLCHGFRWLRRSIRVYVILQDLEDASPSWIIKEPSAAAILHSFGVLFDFVPQPPGASAWGAVDDALTAQGRNGRSRNGSRNGSRSASRASSRPNDHGRSRSRSDSTNKPVPPLPFGAPSSVASSQNGGGDEIGSQAWSAVTLLEEYDPADLTSESRPYAYVADYAVRIDLSVDIGEHMARYEAMQKYYYPDTQATNGESPPSKHWFERLRDQLQAEADVRWYVVVNDDEVREFPDTMEKRPAVPSKTQPVTAKSPSQPVSRSQSQSGVATNTGFMARKRSEADHHALYTMQQSIFERKDRELDGQEANETEQSSVARSVHPIVAPVSATDAAAPVGTGSPGVGGPAEDYHQYLQRLQGLNQQRMNAQPPAVPEKDGASPKASRSSGLKRIFGRKKTEPEVTPG